MMEISLFSQKLMHVRKVASFEQLIIPYNYCFLGRKHHVHGKILTSWQRKKHVVSVSEKVKINNCVFYKHLWQKHAIICYLCNFLGIFLQLLNTMSKYIYMDSCIHLLSMWSWYESCIGYTNISNMSLNKCTHSLMCVFYV